VSANRHSCGKGLNIVGDMDLRPSPHRRRRTSILAGVQLKTYTLYITDDRYSVPSLDVTIVSTDKLAQAIARKRFAVSTHYSAIEIWEDDRLVAKIERPQGLGDPCQR
jgi:hypothetical protein